jgi:hypothetical protein
MRAAAARSAGEAQRLMTKHKDLGVARGGRPAHQEQAAQQSAEDQVEQSQTYDH